MAFRADASVEIGTGHVMRCLALATALRGQVDVTFLCRPGIGDARQQIERTGFKVITLAQGPATAGQDATECDRRLREESGSIDLIVADHYRLASGWETKMRAVARKVMAIDDLADRPHDCDLLLDQNLDDGAGQRYGGLVPPGARLLIGPQYALLRPEFFERAAAARGPRTRIDRLFVFFGGSDPTEETEKALIALADPRLADLAVDVVIGPANQREEQIASLCKKLGQARLIRDARDMAGLMAASDLALGAGGITAWERCAVGLPAIVVATADNQRRGAGLLAARGATIYLGTASEVTPGTMAEAVARLRKAPERLETLSRESSAVLGGHTTMHVVDAVMELIGGAKTRIHFRPAASSDAELLRTWRNDPYTRQWSFSMAEVSRSEHEHWLKSCLQNETRRLYVASCDGQAIGTIRADGVDGTCEVSWTVAPEVRGKGYGSEMVRAAVLGLGGEVFAQIKSANTGSMKIAARAGLSLAEVGPDGTQVWKGRFGPIGPLRSLST